MFETCTHRNTHTQTRQLGTVVHLIVTDEGRFRHTPYNITFTHREAVHSLKMAVHIGADSVKVPHLLTRLDVPGRGKGC